MGSSRSGYSWYGNTTQSSAHLNLHNRLDALSLTQKSAAWSHFDREVSRSFDNSGRRVITIIYRCRHKHPKHLTCHLRERSKHSQGTTNLLNAARKCDENRSGAGAVGNKDAGAVPPQTYSETLHRVIIAVRCAVYKRPFNMVADPPYVHELQLLHPGIRVPAPITVQRDVERLYEGTAGLITVYFKVFIALSV